MYNMDIIGHVAAAPGPLAYSSLGVWPLAFPRPRTRPRNCLNQS